jgi:cell division transport system permease protein
VYLKDDITQDQLRTVDDLIGGSGLSAHREYISKSEAIGRFKKDFPDLAGAAGRLDANPFPASFEIRLKPEVRDAGGAVDNLATTLAGLGGVADVRYDRRWLARLNGVVRMLRSLGLGIVLLLAFASALTVASVVRLAATAREDEIEIMTLVGAPLTYVRGPFIMEGVLQGGVGALVGIVFLWAIFVAANARYGTAAAQSVGLGGITFLPWSLSVLIVLGGMVLGCLGGVIVARGVRGR